MINDHGGLQTPGPGRDGPRKTSPPHQSTTRQDQTVHRRQRRVSFTRRPETSSAQVKYLHVRVKHELHLFF